MRQLKVLAPVRVRVTAVVEDLVALLEKENLL